jgi:hypothetical protein
MGSVNVDDDDDRSHRSSGSSTAARRHDRAGAAQNESVDADAVQMVLNEFETVSLAPLAVAGAAPEAGTQPRENTPPAASFDTYPLDEVTSEAEFDQALESADCVMSLGINTHFLTIDNSPHVARFSALQTLELLLGTAPGLATAEKRLLQAVPCTPVEELYLKIHAGVPEGASGGPDYDPRSVPGLLADASEAALKCSALRTLGVSCAELREPVEGFRLDRLLPHTSLRRVNLCLLSLENASNGSFQHRVPGDYNDTLQSIDLSMCRLGGDGLRVISCFRGLESIAFENVTFDPFPTTPPTEPSIFAELEKLASVKFEVSSTDGETKQDRQVQWLASNFKHIPFSLEVISRYIGPSMKDLLVNHSGTLSLECDWSAESESNLCSGIEQAQSLSSLELHMTMYEDVSITPVLDSLSANSSILQFVGDFLWYDSDGPENILAIGPRVQALVSGNASLKSLAVGFRQGDWFTYSVAAFVARGLCRNRHLQVVNFSPGRREWRPFFEPDGPSPVSGDASAEIVLMLENYNTTLQQLEGLEYENREHEERIEYLLSLNRRGPSFVANASAGRVQLREWGDFLARISTDDCNQFVVNLARQALFGGQGGEARGPPREHA